MFCAECGAEIGEKAAVCLKCGVPVAGKAFPSAPDAAVQNHMVGAILTTIFCCWAGGIVAIVYAGMANLRLAQGDVEGARAASKAARNWIVADIVLAGAAYLLYLLFYAGVALGALA